MPTVSDEVLLKLPNDLTEHSFFEGAVDVPFKVSIKGNPVVRQNGRGITAVCHLATSSLEDV